MSLLSTLPTAQVADLHAIELTTEHEGLLQKFFEQNPQYFLQVLGEPVSSNAAHEEIHAAPPSGWPYTKRHMIGYLDQVNSIAAIASNVSIQDQTGSK